MDTKLNITLTPQHVKELNSIERDTDRPRSRVIRRAIEEYLLRYRNVNPEFAKRNPRDMTDMSERDLKPGLQSDIVVIRGMKKEVIITDTGWRIPVEDDYVPFEEAKVMSVIDVPR